MTSGNFKYIPVNSIEIDRENRQRRQIEGIDELADSIRKIGLINPIVVTSDHRLVAGERRLTAHKQLGFDKIAVQYVEDLPPLELHLIELEENIRRSDLTWQDQVNAVAAFHGLKSEQHDGAWTPENTAEELNMSRRNVDRQLLVKQYLEAEVPEVCEAERLSVAANFAQRAHERKKTSAMRDLFAEPESQVLEKENEGEVIYAADVPAAVPKRRAEILNTNFKKWSKEVRETPYNLIHCDFPYGINTGDKKRGLVYTEATGGYEDSEETYNELLDLFLSRQDNFTSPSAHLIFWLSMKTYQETRTALQAAGWVVSPYPFIWHKTDNSGILSDPSRQPRHIYETALFATRGDRKIVRAVGNCYGGAISRQFHMSEKPKPMLEHFMRMLVDETTVMLDPTCGSGNSVAIAERLGANWATGLELNSEFALRAKENLDLT